MGIFNESSDKISEEEYREVIRINPNDAEAHWNLGTLLEELNRFEEAEREYREVIRINPDDAEAHWNLGTLLKSLKRYEEAEREYREAIRIGYDDKNKLADAHYYLGTLLEELNRFEEAEEEYREVIRINPNDAEAQNNLSKLEKIKKELTTCNTNETQVDLLGHPVQDTTPQFLSGATNETPIDLSGDLDWKECTVREGIVSFKCPKCKEYYRVHTKTLIPTDQAIMYRAAGTNVILSYLMGFIIALICCILLASIFGYSFFITIIGVLIWMGLGKAFSTKGLPVWIFKCKSCGERIFVASDGANAAITVT